MLLRALTILVVILSIAIYAAQKFRDRTGNDGPVVELPLGRLSGTKMASRFAGRDILAFKGIPYARPPVGELRFAVTEPLTDRWEEIRQATEFGNRCPQTYSIGPMKRVSGDEDCLYLNVYVPKVDEDQKVGPLPVMVWVHGGGFVSGDGGDRMYGPRYLLDRDVILVTFNYRLGPLGTLSLDIDGAAGNQALWDQRQALVWVQQNIAAFGGDPARVTLFGESAGGMSVSYHLVSKQSEGLFSAAIVQSGPVHRAGLNLDLVRPLSHYHSRYADKVGCASSNKREVMECLRKMPMPDLLVDMPELQECNLGALSFPALWRPSHRECEDLTRSFFTEDPRSLVEKGSFVDGIEAVMMGHNKHEGLFYMAPAYKERETFEFLKQNWNKCIAHNLLGKFSEDVTEAENQLVKEASEMYFGIAKDGLGGDELSKEHLDLLAALATDSNFAHGTDLAVRSLQSHIKASVFSYRFDHVGSFSVSDLIGGNPILTAARLVGKLFGYHTTDKLGACHADDLFYLFSSELPVSILSESGDEEMSKVMVDLWANFAIHRDPTPKEGNTFVGHSLKNFDSSWRAADEDAGIFARLENGRLNQDTDEWAEKRLAFWKNLEKVLYKFQ